MIPSIQDIQWVQASSRNNRNGDGKTYGAVIAPHKAGALKSGETIFTNSLALYKPALEKTGFQVGDRVLVGQIEHEGRLLVAVKRDLSGWALAKGSENVAVAKFSRKTSVSELPFTKKIKAAPDDLNFFQGVLFWEVKYD